LTVTQLVLPLHECVVEPLQDAAEAAAESATEPLHSIADPTAAESTIEPLLSVVEPAATSAALAETSSYVFRFESLANHIIEDKHSQTKTIII
jgi:hypothetical protein